MHRSAKTLLGASSIRTRTTTTGCSSIHRLASGVSVQAVQVGWGGGVVQIRMFCKMLRGPHGVNHDGSQDNDKLQKASPGGSKCVGTGSSC